MSKTQKHYKKSYIKGLFCTTVLASASLFSSQVSAAPAVSETNATIDLGGGIMNDRGTGTASGILDIPLNENYAVQIDTLLRQSGSVTAGGLAGHLFYRDPESFLLGATSLWHSVEGRDVYRFGAESEIYLKDFTIAPSIGIQNGDINQGADAFYDVDVSYYPHDNLKLTLTGGGFSDTLGASGEVEWQPREDMPFRVYGTLGDSNVTTTYALIGIRYSFGGENVTLKHRNRYMDPENILEPFDQLIGNAAATGVFRTKPAASSPGPSPAPGPSPFGG